MIVLLRVLMALGAALVAFILLALYTNRVMKLRSTLEGQIHLLAMRMMRRWIYLMIGCIALSEGFIISYIFGAWFASRYIAPLNIQRKALKDQFLRQPSAVKKPSSEGMTWSDLYDTRKPYW